MRSPGQCRTACHRVPGSGLTGLRKRGTPDRIDAARFLAIIDGFKIGQWVANRRAGYRKGRLPADRNPLAVAVPQPVPTW